MKFYVEKLIGDKLKIPSEHKLYNAAWLLSIMLCFFYAVFSDYVVAVQANTTIVAGSGMMLAAFYALSMVKQYRYGKLQQEISRLKQMETKLQRAEQQWHNLIENINDIIFTLNTQEIFTYINHAVEKEFLYQPAEIIGMPLRHFVHPEDLPRVIAAYKTALAGDPRPHDFRFFDKHGNTRYVSCSSRPLMEDDELIGVTGVIVDITERKHMEDELRKHRDNLEELVIERTAELNSVNDQLCREIAERKQAEAQLKHLATHDYLTSVPNRYSFEESLKKTVAKAKRGMDSSLLFIDIDNFKLVNDTKGHTAGDHLLINVANTIKENIRESDVLARLGGDEFAVLLEGITVDEARHAAENLRQKIEEKEFRLHRYGSFNLSFSIGVAMIDGTLNSQRLLTLADTALYAAKGKGGNRVILLDPNEETTTKSAFINQLVTQLKNAIKEDKFVLYLQPVVQAADGDILHYEALLRLPGENGDIISPHAFIPVAEQFGLMPQIDGWVVKAALNMLRQDPDLNVFVNISGISLSDESLLEYIEDMIAQSGAVAARLGFEITETVAVQDMQLAQLWIDRLKKFGCRFALDDFGIGFSSFSYLQMLPVDYLKIDGSFISNLDKDTSQRALVEAMNTVAHSLGKKTIAEYVENEHVLHILRELNIDCAQGYYLGVPKPIQPKI